ncbi:hypothetical protein ECZU03_13850 [Escherichia coli]|nr:hypothetical protein ECZU03_13850 [Escherichia coli]
MRSFNVLCHIKSMPQERAGGGQSPPPLLIPCGYRVGRKGTSQDAPSPRIHARRPASRERFGDFDATNTRAVFL